MIWLEDVLLTWIFAHMGLKIVSTYLQLSIVCLCFDAFAGKVSERLLLELRSEGL